MKKVLITDGVHPSLKIGLEAMGYHCDYDPEIPLEKVRQIVGNYEGLIINSKILVDKQMLDAATALRFVGRLGSGLEIIDLAYAAEKGVAILNSPEGNRNAVAEHALGMLLALNNKFLQSDREVRANVWEREKYRGREIMGSGLAIPVAVLLKNCLAWACAFLHSTNTSQITQPISLLSKPLGRKHSARKQT